MSLADQCFGLVIKNDVVIDEDLREKIKKHLLKLFTSKKKFKDDAFEDEENVPFEIYFGLVWKKRKAVCLTLTSRARENVEKFYNILSKLSTKDIEIDKDISLNKPQKIEHCDFERFKKKKGEKLWDRLEHNGPYFPHIFEPYQPLGLSISYDGKVYKLNREEEQAFAFFAKRIITESKPTNKKFFVKNKTFRDNYFNSLQEYLTPEHRKIFKNFDKFDFTKMVQKIEEKKEEKDEIKKSRSKEEKVEEKIDRLERKLNYNFAYVDGVKKELKSYAVEIQGLYVGAGNVMTHKGKIKKLIQPEDVTINVSKGDVPNPPPGHTWGGVVNDPTAGWTARYKDEITGGFKYVRLKETGDLLKFEKARKLNKYIDVIDTKIETLLSSNSEINRQIGVVIYLIKNFGFRVGTLESDDIDVEGEDKGEKVVGATTLMVENIKPLEDNKIDLRFFGKDSQLYENTLDVSKTIYDNIISFMKGKKQKDQLFDKISAPDVNNYLKGIDRDFTAKVFRTRLASSVMYEGLQNFTNYKKGATDDEKINDFNSVNKEVAIRLNHKKGITEAQKEGIAKEKKKLKEYKVELKELQDADGNKEKIKRLKVKIKEKEFKLKDKKENLGIALETSKKNYIDPRVIKSWAELIDISINKIYKSKELQKHFKWAIEDEEVNGDWDYLETPLDCIVGSELEPKTDKEIIQKKKVEKSPKENVQKKKLEDKPLIKLLKDEEEDEDLPLIDILKKKDIEEEEEEDEDLPLIERIKKRDYVSNEINLIQKFCQSPNQANFIKLSSETKRDFINFSNLIIKLKKGNIELAKKVIKLKV